MKTKKLNWYIVQRRSSSDAKLSQHVVRALANPKRYAVYGPFNLARARFNLYGC